MDQLNYKEKLESLRRSGLTEPEIRRLTLFRLQYVFRPQDRSQADLAHLKFVRWLVEHGQMSEW